MVPEPWFNLSSSSSGSGGGGSFNLISDQVLAAPATNITFTAIPATYFHLWLILQLKTDEAQTDFLSIIMNGGGTYDSLSNSYEGNNAFAADNTYTVAQVSIGSATTLFIPGTTGFSAASSMSAVCFIPRYAGTTFWKEIQVTAGGGDRVQSALGTGQAVTTGGFFTAQKTETINNIISYCATAFVAPNPTLCRMGFYIVNPDSSITLVASMANDVTLWSVTGRNSRALSAAFNKVAGQRYGIGHVCVTTGTAPIIAANGVSSSPMAIELPMLCTAAGGQSDLPASMSLATLQGGLTGTNPYGEVTP